MLKNFFNKGSKYLLQFCLLAIIPIISFCISEILIGSINRDLRNSAIESILVESNALLEESIRKVEPDFVIDENANFATVCSGQYGEEIQQILKEPCYQFELYKESLKEVNVKHICSGQVESDFQELCSSGIDTIIKVDSYSKILIIVTILSVIFLVLLAYIAKKFHKLLLINFYIGIYFGLIVSAFMLLASCVMLLIDIYYLEAYFLDMVHINLIALIGLVGFIGAFTLLKNTVKKILYTNIEMGISVTSEDQPKLWDLVEKISDKIGIKKPDNIIIGLGTNYYVTENTVKCYSGKCDGRTLFISISLLNELTVNELTAILAHEMAHFKNKDTVFGIKFATAWNKFYRSIQELNNMGSILVIPVISLLNLYLNLFDNINAEHSKKTEKEADKTAAEITSPIIFSQALAKISFYSIIYDEVVELAAFKAISEDKCITNKSEYFREIIKNEEICNTAKARLKEMVVSHPRDSHPSLMERMNALNVNLSQISLKIKKGEKEATSLVKGLTKTEENLSILDQKILFDRLSANKKLLDANNKNLKE